MLHVMFREAADEGAQQVDVGMAVVNSEVQVSITARRVVRSLGGVTVSDSVRRPLDVVMADHWNSETVEPKVCPRRA